MKISQLKMAIREVVREEIRLALKEVIGERKQPVQKPKQKQKYTKNSVLNEVLNETNASEWETMGEETFTSDRMGELVGKSYADMMNGQSDQPRQPNVDGRVREMGANPSSVPQEVKDNIFNKDYSGLMKAIDEKQKQKNGG